MVLSSYYKAPKDKIAEVLSKLLAYKGIICEHKEALLRALNLYANYELHILDCLLAAKSSSTDNSTIFTFNQELLNIISNKNTAPTE